MKWLWDGVAIVGLVMLAGFVWLVKQYRVTMEWFRQDSNRRGR